MKKIIGYGITVMVVYYGVFETAKIIGTVGCKLSCLAVKAVNKMLSEQKKKKEEMANKDIYETYFVD